MPTTVVTRPKHPPPVSAGGGGSGLLTGLNFVATSYQGTATFDHFTDTHGPFAIGASQPGPKLIVVPMSVIDAFGAISSVTCNGTAMNLIGALNNGGGQNVVNIFYLQVAGSVTSATIAVTGHTPSAALEGSEIAVYWGAGYNPVPTDHTEHPRQTITVPGTMDDTFTVPVGGFGIVVFYDASTGELITLSGTAVVTDGTADSGANNSGISKFAHLLTAGSVTVSGAGQGGGYILASAAAAWGP